MNREEAARTSRDVIAAAVVSVAAVAFYVSSASLLFQGPLEAFLPTAIGAALLGGGLLALLASFRLSLPLASPGLDPTAVPVLAIVSASVAAASPGPAMLPTTLLALVVTGLAIGGSWWLLGRLGWGELTRYIPFPVVAGFLASGGWLMTVGGVGVGAGEPVQLATFAAWLRGDAHAGAAALALAIGAGLWAITQFTRHPLALPAGVLAAALAVHAGLWLAGLDRVAAEAAGWLMVPFRQAAPAWPGAPDLLAQVRWDAIAMQVPLIASAVLVATVSLLLSTSTIEMVCDRRADFNADLRVLGAGNVAVAVAGGIVGGLSTSRTALNLGAGAQGRISMAVKGGLCLAALVWGAPAIALVPRPVLGGMLVFIGLGMLKTWVSDLRPRLSRTDQGIVLAMLTVTAAAGFMPAVGLGVLACCVSFVVTSSRLSPVRRLLARSAWPDKVERSAAEAERLAQAGARSLVVELQGALFFGSATRLERQLEPLLHDAARPERLLLDFAAVRSVDTSALQALAKLVKNARHAGVEVAVSGLPDEASAMGRLEAAGVLDGVERHRDIDAAVARWDAAVLAADPHPPLADVLDVRLPPASRAPFERRRLQAGERLFERGDPSDALYFVESGCLEIVIAEGDDERVVRTILPGGAVGEMGLFRGSPRSAGIRAAAPSCLLMLSRERLEGLERTDPAAAAALYRLFVVQMAGRIDQLTRQAQALAR